MHTWRNKLKMSQIWANGRRKSPDKAIPWTASTSERSKRLSEYKPPLTCHAHSKSDGAILASRKIAPDREQRSESNFPSNWWSSRLRKWKLSHFTTMELCHCHGCIFFVPLARRRAKKNPVLLEGNQSMVLGSWATYLLTSQVLV